MSSTTANPWEVAPRWRAAYERRRDGVWRSSNGVTEFDRIRTFWIGPRLPDFQQMCLRSWRAVGYQVEVFAYDPLDGVPDGCRLRDAAQVLPRAALFERAPTLDRQPYTRANIFRMAMLAQGLGPWCDSDYLMFRPLPKVRDLLLGREQNGHLCNAVLWAPPDFEMMRRILASFEARDLPPWSLGVTYARFLRARLLGRRLAHNEFPKHQWGRSAVDFFVRKHQLEDQVQPYEAFYYPVIYDDMMYRAGQPFDHLIDDPKIHGLHFFYSAASRFRDAEPGSFIDWAKRRFA